MDLIFGKEETLNKNTQQVNNSEFNVPAEQDEDEDDEKEVELSPEEKKKLEEEEEAKREEQQRMLDGVKIQSGDYMVQVHIIEVRDLPAKDLSGTSDPVVFMEVFGEKQSTEVKDQCLSCVFDELFIGSCNNLAITAAKNIVTSPGKRFNPLFVYGKPGVGKTHLLKTIERSSFSSFYIDSESFLESYINGIKNKDIDIFKNKIRSVDILLIDDIQFFLGKKGVSEELFHTINYFLNNSKAVVLASDQKPQELIGFPERLVSRILNGLVTDIEKPDQKIFSEVLNRNNLEYGGNLITNKEFNLLTSLEFQSFREINGVVNNLIINKQTGAGNSSYVAELVSMYSNNKVLELTPEFILDYCSDLYQVDKRLVLSKNRSEQVSNARHLFIYLMRKHTEYSLNQIGLYVGNRSHSTVLSSIKKEIDSD